MKLIPTNTKREDCVQTPIEYAQAIINHFKPSGKTLEPCSGEGNFLKAYPFTASCEILEGSDFFNETESYNWIITNPPYSQMRKFMQHSMKIADNIVFLTSINHLWLKARIRDIDEANYGIREILLCDTPKTFPQSGFQFGCFHLKKGWKGDIKFSKLSLDALWTDGNVSKESAGQHLKLPKQSSVVVERKFSLESVGKDKDKKQESTK